MSKARLTHIDNAKAIGMMLIVASHVVPTKEVVDSVLFQTWNGLINSFYVPLFFILSGVFQSSSTDYKKLERRMLILIRYCALSICVSLALLIIKVFFILFAII